MAVAPRSCLVIYCNFATGTMVTWRTFFLSGPHIDALAKPSFTITFHSSFYGCLLLFHPPTYFGNSVGPPRLLLVLHISMGLKKSTNNAVNELRASSHDTSLNDGDLRARDDPFGDETGNEMQYKTMEWWYVRRDPSDYGTPTVWRSSARPGSRPSWQDVNESVLGKQVWS